MFIFILSNTRASSPSFISILMTQGEINLVLLHGQIKLCTIYNMPDPHSKTDPEHDQLPSMANPEHDRSTEWLIPCMFNEELDQSTICQIHTVWPDPQYDHSTTCQDPLNDRTSHWLIHLMPILHNAMEFFDLPMYYSSRHGMNPPSPSYCIKLFLLLL